MRLLSSHTYSIRRQQQQQQTSISQVFCVKLHTICKFTFQSSDFEYHQCSIHITASFPFLYVRIIIFTSHNIFAFNAIIIQFFLVVVSFFAFKLLFFFHQDDFDIFDSVYFVCLFVVSFSLYRFSIWKSDSHLERIGGFISVYVSVFNVLAVTLNASK